MSTKQNVLDLANVIKHNVDESSIYEYFDQQIHEYVDYDQMQRRNIDSIQEWYVRFGRGEAESDVLHWVSEEINEEPNDKLREAIKIAYPDAPV